MIVVPMAEHQLIHRRKIDPQKLGVVHRGEALARIEKDTLLIPDVAALEREATR